MTPLREGGVSDALAVWRLNVEGKLVDEEEGKRKKEEGGREGA